MREFFAASDAALSAVEAPSDALDKALDMPRFIDAPRFAKLSGAFARALEALRLMKLGKSAALLANDEPANFEVPVKLFRRETTLLICLPSLNVLTVYNESSGPLTVFCRNDLPNDSAT